MVKLEKESLEHYEKEEKDLKKKNRSSIFYEIEDEDQNDTKTDLKKLCQNVKPIVTD